MPVDDAEQYMSSGAAGEELESGHQDRNGNDVVNGAPGAFVHNGKYMVEPLCDSIADLGTKVTMDLRKMVRP